MTFERLEGEALLERTPAVLRSLLLGMPEGWTRASEGEGSWTPHDIVGHLVHCELDDWIPRAEIILSDADERRFDPFDRFAPIEGNRTRPLTELLERFDELRAANLGKLRSWPLTAEQIARTGTHPQFGLVTLGQLLCTWVAHDLSHLAQVARVMSRRLGPAVGPWAKYLPILGSPGA